MATLAFHVGAFFLSSLQIRCCNDFQYLFGSVLGSVSTSEVELVKGILHNSQKLGHPTNRLAELLLGCILEGCGSQFRFSFHNFFGLDFSIVFWTVFGTFPGS